MSTVFIKTYKEPDYNISEILRYAASKPTKEIDELLNECIKELEGKLSYRVCYTELTHEGHFESIKSNLLEKYLVGCEKYILFAATIGIEIDRLISKYSRISPAKAHMFQAIGAERTEALCDMFCGDMKEQYLHTKPRVSPGYGDMPLEMQREVFEILDCPRKIGVSLGDSLLMSPSKSVTAFIGVLK